MDLKINESKVLEFSAIIEGGEANDLKAKLRIMIGEIEYGFPVSLDGKKMKVKIPALKEHVKVNQLRKAKNAEARLDIVTQGKLFTPWKDSINLEVPLKVKAEMTDIKEFLEEADNIIKVSKVEEKTDSTDEKTKTEGEIEVEVGKEEENEMTNFKKKSKFSIMLEDKGV